MSRGTRFGAYGSAALLIPAGVACAAVIGGGLGDVLALALIGAGLVAITSLVFLEVGLSEDRARETEQRAARQTEPRHGHEQRPGSAMPNQLNPPRQAEQSKQREPGRQPVRPSSGARPLGRMRGQRRKLG